MVLFTSRIFFSLFHVPFSVLLQTFYVKPAPGTETKETKKQISESYLSSAKKIMSMGYFRLGQDVIRRGDACCVFIGARLPFIIRPTQNISCYKMVEDAFIHGVS